MSQSKTKSFVNKVCRVLNQVCSLPKSNIPGMLSPDEVLLSEKNKGPVLFKKDK